MTIKNLKDNEIKKYIILNKNKQQIKKEYQI